MSEPKFSLAGAYVSSSFQFNGLMLIAPGSTTTFEAFSFTFLGPSVFQLMITPVSFSPVANFK